ncbi:MAG: carbohydrate ABC transporter permease [Acidilobaceae archaeon]|jgi:multiple sugar transport system permease protein
MRIFIKSLLSYFIALTIVTWILAPLFLSLLSAFIRIEYYYRSFTIIPLSLQAYTLDNVKLLLTLGAHSALVRSLQVGVLVVMLCVILGVPAGYALGRFVFRGRDSIKLFVLSFRLIPVALIAVPIAKVLLTIGLYDSIVGLALVHTALALPFVILITANVFASIPRDLEEVGFVFGMSRLQVFLRITAPLALPGITASALFAFLISWNEVFAASVLTLTERTLPAFVITAFGGGTRGVAPDPFKFASILFLVLPAILIMAYIRKYLVVMWGTTR